MALSMLKTIFVLPLNFFFLLLGLEFSVCLMPNVPGGCRNLGADSATLISGLGGRKIYTPRQISVCKDGKDEKSKSRKEFATLISGEKGVCMSNE